MANKKFERKLDNAIGQGVRTTNGAKTTVRVAPKEVGTTKKGMELRGASKTTGKTASAKMPTRKRDVNKAVTNLHKKVSK